MDSWLQDELLSSWEQAYQDGESPGCIMGFGDLLSGIPIVSSPMKSNHKTKKQKRKKKTSKEIIDQKVQDLLEPSNKTILSTPMGPPQDPVYIKHLDQTDKQTDNWFLEWLGLEPAKDTTEDWFLEWLGVPKETK